MSNKVQIEVTNAPFEFPYGNASVKGVLSRSQGDARQEAINAMGRGQGMREATATAVALLVKHLKAIDVELSRNGEDWPLPADATEKAEWVGYLPMDLTMRIVEITLGADLFAKSEAEKVEEGNS